MFPLSDDNTDRHLRPFLTWAIIGLNLFVFVVLQGLGSNAKFTYAFSTVPAEIAAGRDLITPDRVVRDPRSGQRFTVPGLQPTPRPVHVTLLTSMFMHGGIAHILGNMWFLLVFGDNVENSLGRGRFAAFYLATGLLASFAHVVVTYMLSQDPTVPSLGASGAISGVLGGYVLLFPHRRVRVLMLRQVVDVPAIAAVGLWFAFQVISGLGMLGGRSGGVAYGAHIGGFVAGLALVRVFAPRGGMRPTRPA